MKYVYGPVESRRLGLSLGISLTPYKTCNFDCIYCQLGGTAELSRERKEYIPVAVIIEELRSWIACNPREAQNLNYITLSGFGEPTLNIRIEDLISEIKKISSAPIALITNASLLSDPSVRRSILQVDLIVPSLDAVTPRIFAKIDRPNPEIKIEDIIDGLIALRKEFRGRIWLETMLVSGINDDIRHIKKLKKVVDMVRPDKIQLNSPVRCAPGQDAPPVDQNKLKKISEILGEKSEII
jgi:wyosine [tRNA(Phe)-imidazoG37] synthetase (radical SAM superfamily)